MRRRAFVRASLLAALWFPQPAGAQSVRVSVVDRASRSPVPGAIASLVGRDGSRVAVLLTDERGQVTLRAQTGHFVQVIVESIGFATSRSAEFELVPGTTDLEVRLESRPLLLPKVAVRDRRRCETGSTGEATATLWEEVRKALTATTLSQNAASLAVWRYVRRLDRSHRILAETTTTSGRVGARFATASAQTLQARGFTQEVDGAALYFAPDAELLLEASFVQGHCFGLKADDGSHRVVGLTFEPQPGRTTPDIAGVLWIDAKSGDLRWMEFTYSQQQRAAGDEKAGGRIEYERLPNGSWVVTRWYIRLPVIARSGGNQVGRLITPARDTLIGFREEGGWLTAAGVPQPTSATANLTGVVFDSIRSQPVTDARIVLGGGAAEARTDSTGRFSLRHFMPGRYLIRAEHPRLSSFGSDLAEREVVLTVGRTTVANWAVASRATLLSRFCRAGSTGSAPERAVITEVVESSSGFPIEGARTTARWRAIRLRKIDGAAVTSTVDSVAESRSDSNGFVTFCIGGAESQVTLHVEHEGREASRSVSLPDTTVLLETRLSVPMRLDRNFHLRGRVVARSAPDRSIAAEIMIPSLGRTYHTDREGRVDIAGLGAGPLAVIIRSPGYEPLYTRTVIPQKDSEPTFALDLLPQPLQTVTVTGARDVRGFEERRAVQAGGTYISRDDLAARESSRLSDVLRSVRGVRIQRRPDGSLVLVSSRGTFSRSVRDCFYQIILDGQRIFALGSGGPSGTAVPPSIDDFAPNGLEGIEVYAGPAATPLQFGGLGAACGTIILWTRRN